jgi:SAM-dependent methyltransferase
LDSAILDVGCGSGDLLRRMQRYGFTRLTGVDPYAPEDIAEANFKIVKGELSEVDGKFDLIMAHHVLEHMQDPFRALTSIRERLTKGGRILVRTPLAGSYAYRHYGPHWFNLDAPRHLNILSVRGLHRLAERAGLKVCYGGFDSNELALSMSESYKNDIPAREARAVDSRTRRKYRKTTRRLNASGEGDTGIFVLTT